MIISPYHLGVYGEPRKKAAHDSRTEIIYRGKMIPVESTATSVSAKYVTVTMQKEELTPQPIRFPDGSGLPPRV